MRDLRLGAECAARVAPTPERFGREDPLATISQSPSGRPDAMFGDSTVRDWKVEWERTWDGDATGADVKAQMEVLEVCDEELDGRRTLHARASIPWRAWPSTPAPEALRLQQLLKEASYCAEDAAARAHSRAPSVIGSRPRITIGWPTSCHY